MADTEIEWATKVWNFVRGCRRVSPGCGGANGQGGCYAEKTAYRFSGPGMPYEGLVTLGAHGPRWNGAGRFVPEKLGEPLRWRKPSDGSRHRIFVNSMSDLFFEEFSNEQIAAGFGVMAACPQHDFLILTKRPKRAAEWFKWIRQQGSELPRLVGAVCPLESSEEASACLMLANRQGGTDGLFNDSRSYVRALNGSPWPLPNVWLGVSCENQETANERIPLLLKLPAVVRFISAEPLLGTLDLSRWLTGSNRFHVLLSVSGALKNGSFDGLGGPDGKTLTRIEAKRELERLRDAGVKVVPSGGCDDFCDQKGCRGHRNPSIDWCIVGGESGHGARPLDVAWAESIVRQCKDAGAAVFVKQLGGNHFAPWKVEWDRRLDGSFDAFSRDRVGVRGTNLATVWPNGTWHTWDANGTGGENACETIVDAAKSAALEALQRQHVAPIKGWARHAHMLRDRKGGDMSEWPESLRVREFPAVRA